MLGCVCVCLAGGGGWRGEIQILAPYVKNIEVAITYHLWSIKVQHSRSN